MNYLTNYYKNLSEQLKVRYVELQRFLAEDMEYQGDVTSQPTNMMAKGGGRPPMPGPTPSNYPPTNPRPNKAPIQQPGKQSEKPKNPPGGRGDGLSEGWKGPHEKGPTSKEWQEWIKQPGNWHKLNPHPYGSPQFYRWEWEYYQQPPGP